MERQSIAHDPAIQLNGYGSVGFPATCRLFFRVANGVDVSLPIGSHLSTRLRYQMMTSAEAASAGKKYQRWMMISRSTSYVWHASCGSFGSSSTLLCTIGGSYNQVEMKWCVYFSLCLFPFSLSSNCLAFCKYDDKMRGTA